jgi:hypothetical protein
MLSPVDEATQTVRQAAPPVPKSHTDNLERTLACALHKVALGLQVTCSEKALLRRGSTASENGEEFRWS